MIIRRNDETSKAREQVSEQAGRKEGFAFACWLEQKRDEEWMVPTCCKRVCRGLSGLVKAEESQAVEGLEGTHELPRQLRRYLVSTQLYLWRQRYA